MRSARLAAVIALALAAGTAEAREWPPGRIIAALDGGRFLLARSTDEGVILRFCGAKGRDDDPVILLRDFTYVEAVEWLEGTGTAVVAAGMDESPPDLFGFSGDGDRLWTKDCGDALDGARFLPLPGDSTLGLVPADESGGRPRPIAPPGTIGSAGPGYPGPRARDVCGRGTRVIEWRLDRGAPEITCRDILQREPLWTTTLPDSVNTDRMGQSGGVIGTGTAWLAWQCGFDPFTVVALDLYTGAEIARRTVEGYAARFYAEPGGSRLLLWLQDRDHRGRMLLLDGMTLATRDTLAEPTGWYPQNFDAGGNRQRADGVTVARLHGAGLPQDARGDDQPAEPLALVVTWGEQVTVHFLPVAACLDAVGEVKVWYEWHSDGSWRHIEVATWTPPRNPQDEARWVERWSRIRR